MEETPTKQLRLPPEHSALATRFVIVEHGTVVKDRVTGEEAEVRDDLAVLSSGVIYVTPMAAEMIKRITQEQGGVAPESMP